MLHAAVALSLALAGPTPAQPDTSVASSVSLAEVVIPKKALHDVKYALGKDAAAAVRAVVQSTLEEGHFFERVEESGGTYVLHLEIVRARTEFQDRRALASRRSSVLVTGEVAWRWTRGEETLHAGTFSGTGDSETSRLRHTHANARSYGVVDSAGQISTDQPLKENFTLAWEDFLTLATREAFISTFDAGKFGSD